MDDVLQHSCMGLAVQCLKLDAELCSSRSRDAGALDAVTAALATMPPTCDTATWANDAIQQIGAGGIPPQLRQRTAAVQESAAASTVDEALRAIESAEAQADVPAILALMTAHLEHAGVQLRGCVALHSLTQSDDTQGVAASAAAAAGAIDAMLAAMRTHGGDAAVQEKACSALFNICFRNQVTAGDAERHRGGSGCAADARR